MSALATGLTRRHPDSSPLPQRRWWRISPAVAILLLTALFLLAGSRLLSVGAMDLRVAGLFSTDEELAGELVRAMVRQGNFGLSHFFSYGPLDLYAARVVLWLWGFAAPVDDHAILLTLRGVSLAAGAGTVASTYLLGRRLWDARTGALAAALVATSATVLAWSTTAHPDMLQLLALQLSLLGLSSLPRRQRTTIIALAAFAAGFAFAAKYGGILLLPVIWLALAVGYGRAAAAQRIHPGTLVLRLFAGSGLSIAVFVATFLLLDPSVLHEWRRFTFQLQTEAGMAHQGHLYATGADPALWLRRLGTADFLGPATLALGLLGGIAWAGLDLWRVARAWRSHGRIVWPEAAACRLPCEVWTLGYLGLLLVWTGDVQVRYALPVLPGLALFAVAGLSPLWSRIPIAVSALVCLLLIAPPAYQAAGYLKAQAQRMQTPAIAQRIAAGQWLEAHVDPSEAVLYDAYAYVPSAFANAQETFALTRGTIESFHPRIILTDSAIRDRFRDPAAAAAYAGGPAAFNDSAAAYRDLEVGLLTCYPPLQHVGPVSIYGTAPAFGPTGRC